MAATTNLRDRERFDALRRQMFREMALAGKRWGLMWWGTIGVIVLAAMTVHGASPARMALQIGAVALAVPSLVHRIRHPGKPDHGQSLLAGMLLFIACVVNTGGCASPLSIMSIPMLFGAALMPVPKQIRMVLFCTFLVAFVAMVLASSGATGDLGRGSGALTLSPIVSLCASIAVGIFVVVGVYKMGQNVSLLYERVALELASRREELCYESEDRTRSLEAIAARVAHEVKNPLAAIKGLSAHMARQATDPKAAERLAIVASEADRLKEIVDGFLSFSRGLDAMKVAPMRPYELAHELSVLLEVRAAEAGVALEVTGNQQLELNADRRKLRQVLLNLVLNALQASPRGKTVWIDVAGPSCGMGATVRVIDQGAGMSPEIVERIKRPYYTTREGGTGLGVVVARALVEQHGGVLSYDSKPGKGTTVTIELPASALEIAKAQKLPDPSREPLVALPTPDVAGGRTT
jgi:signal transduction histidine kinase